MSEGNVEEPNAFDPQVVPGVSLIVLMRIYDVLLAMYTDMDTEGAANLFRVHEEGGIVGSLPWLDLRPDDTE